MHNVDFIIEVANTHGGNKDYVISLIDEFESFQGHGMKFQPLHPDKIATPDFKWYPVYQELFFNPLEWHEIISKASVTKNVWIDLFDTYGVQILEENKRNIFGVKLQASVLYNEHVIQSLSHIDCSSLVLIVNISAIEKHELKERIIYFENKIKPREILLEVGFQSYPTELEDSGLNKLQYLKHNFTNKLVFADHIDGNLEDSITLPLIASMMGAAYIEKHVMHSELPTKYDFFSAIKVSKYAQMVECIKTYGQLNDRPFINDKEKEYLAQSIQKPIASKTLNKGKSVNLIEDLEYRRSNQEGLSALEISKLLNEGYILANTIEKGQTLKRQDFKKAIIAVVIAGRLKSSRLKKKALLKIGELTSIEKCIQSCMSFPESSYTILATSTTEEDDELKDYTYAPSVIFHKGHPDDVIQRYLDIVNKLGIDIIYRVTADMPYASSEIAKILLDNHFKSGADYTAASVAAVGTAPEIMNVQALRDIKKHIPSADYSEYMTWYFVNNKEYFKINIVDLPANYTRDYRLTLDYQEDLDMFNNIQSHLDTSNKSHSINNIFSYLDQNPDVSKLNSHIQLTYKTDQQLIDTLNRVTKINT